MGNIFSSEIRKLLYFQFIFGSQGIITKNIEMIREGFTGGQGGLRTVFWNLPLFIHILFSIYLTFSERGKEGESDRCCERAGVGALPGPGELHAQQADQVCRSQDYHPRSLVNRIVRNCFVNPVPDFALSDSHSPTILLVERLLKLLSNWLTTWFFIKLKAGEVQLRWHSASFLHTVSQNIT